MVRGLLPGLMFTAALAMPSSQALAGFGAKTMRADLPAREVERSLTMAKGWIEFSLGYDHKLGLGQWNDFGLDGQERGITKWDTARWTRQSEWLTLRWGIARRAEFWWKVSFEQAHLKNDALGTNTRDSSFGDPIFGYRFTILQQDAPQRSLVFESWMKFPAGDEGPGTYLGGPLNVSQFVFTTGTTDWYFGLGFKQQLGPIGLTAHAGYEYRFSGLVQYLIEIDNYQFAGRMKPGDRFRADVEVLAQLGPVALIARPELMVRRKTRVGTSSKNVFSNPNLSTVEGSGGIELDIHGEVLIQATRGFDIRLYGSMPVVGEDLMFFPIEDIHRTWGPTFGGAVEVRL